MNRYHFLLVSLAITLLAQTEALAASQPNIVFILADDLGIGDVKCYGKERCLIETPHIDALASGEIRAAAIDVLPKEPPIDGDPLLDYQGDNLMVTPHIAWGTRRARQNAIDELTANIAAWLDGKRRCRVD